MTRQLTYIPRPNSGPEVDKQRLFTSTMDRFFQDVAVQTLTPIGFVAVEDYNAGLGELVVVDPSEKSAADGKGVYLYVHLPLAKKEDAGAMVSVKNYSTSTRAIRVQASGSDTIDKSVSYVDMTSSGLTRSFRVIGDGKWIEWH